MERTFRYLKANEVDVFPKMVKEKGCLVLLFKDARCDMNILDETVGPMNWQRSHVRDNKNCIVSIWDDKKNQWISKEDTGTESNQDKEKGLASDSFKRACFNWGIGRELYTAPFTWIVLAANETYCTNPDEKVAYKKKYALDKKVNFKVSDMEVKDNEIVKLVIKDQNDKVRFNWTKDKEKIPPQPETKPLSKEKILALQTVIKEAKYTDERIIKRFKVSKLEDLTLDQFTTTMNGLGKLIEAEKKKNV